MDLQPAATFTALPNAWIERLFERMAGMYGSKFADMWAGQPPETVKRIWSDGLAGLTGEQIATGLRACMTRQWPPTLPEFVTLCRPPPNYEQLFIQAATASRSSKLAYWGRVAFGHFEMQRATWASAKNRWTQIIDELLQDGELPDIPPQAQALPQPGKTTNSAHQAECMRIIRSLLKPKPPGDWWARRILERAEAGENLPQISLDMAREALK